MKKLISVFVLAFALVSSAFALDIAAGINGNIGGNIGKDYSGYSGLVVGGGGYLNLNFINGFGFQGEMNVTNNQFKVSGNSVTFTDYETIDFAFMPWFQLDLRVLAIGGGVGLNFAYYDDSFFDFDIDTDHFIPGLAIGTNLKIYLSNHFGIVLGGHAVLDFLPTVSVTSKGRSTTYTFENSKFIRKSIYATGGLEFRF